MRAIQVDRTNMRRLLDRAESTEESFSGALETLPPFPDGGIASEQISLIVRLTLEGSATLANATAGVCQVARAAIDDLSLTEREIRDSLEELSKEEFDG